MPMPLSMVLEGQDVILKEIRGGMGIRRRLTDMGLRSGTSVRVVHNNNSGPFVVGIGDTRLMIGRGMAQKIMVEEM